MSDENRPAIKSAIDDFTAFAKAIELLRAAALFECDYIAQRLNHCPIAEQHFLLALSALETAQRHATLASYYEPRGE